MKMETLSKIEKIPELEDFNIGTPRFATEQEPFITEKETFNILFNRAPFKLDIDVISSLSKFSKYLTISLIIINEKDSNQARLHIEIDNNYKVTTDIRNDIKGVKGLGVVLWKKGRDLIEQIANEKNINIVHIVEKDPDLDRIDGERWDKLFIPILEQFGYKETGEKTNLDSKNQIWRKEYVPKNK